jgi:hypothetical protein
VTFLSFEPFLSHYLTKSRTISKVFKVYDEHNLALCFTNKWRASKAAKEKNKNEVQV